MKNSDSSVHIILTSIEYTADDTDESHSKQLSLSERKENATLMDTVND